MANRLDPSESDGTLGADLTNFDGSQLSQRRVHTIGCASALISCGVGEESVTTQATWGHVRRIGTFTSHGRTVGRIRQCVNDFGFSAHVVSATIRNVGWVDRNARNQCVLVHLGEGLARRNTGWAKHIPDRGSVIHLESQLRREELSPAQVSEADVASGPSLEASISQTIAHDVLRAPHGRDFRDIGFRLYGSSSLLKGVHVRIFDVSGNA